MTCGNVLGGQPLRKAIAGRGRLSRTGQPDLSGRRCLVDFEGPAAQPAGFVDAPVCGPAGRTRRLRSRPVKPPQAGLSLRHRHLRRQAADLRTTSQPRPRRQNDSIGALGGRTPSLTTTQGSRSGWLAVILERRLHSCDELHVARRDAQAASSGAQQKAPVQDGLLRDRRVRPVAPSHGASRSTAGSRRGRLRARPPAGAAPAAGAAAAPRLR